MSAWNLTRWCGRQHLKRAHQALRKEEGRDPTGDGCRKMDGRWGGCENRHCHPKRIEQGKVVKSNREEAEGFFPRSCSVPCSDVKAQHRPKGKGVITEREEGEQYYKKGTFGYRHLNARVQGDPAVGKDEGGFCWKTNQKGKLQRTTSEWKNPEGTTKKAQSPKTAAIQKKN